MYSRSTRFLVSRCTVNGQRQSPGRKCIQMTLQRPHRLPDSLAVFKGGGRGRGSFLPEARLIKMGEEKIMDHDQVIPEM